MREREPNKEQNPRGELFFLGHPGPVETFSGYGLTCHSDQRERLVGLLMVDRPRPVDSGWLRAVQEAYGAYQLLPLTATGERGIACRMHIAPDSLAHLFQSPAAQAKALQFALEPLLDEPPNPVFAVHWDEEAGLWRSAFAETNELSPAIREVFANTGYGCLAAATDKGIVHVCHAANVDIDGFAGKPVLSQWQLVKMPTAPLIRLALTIMDQPHNPYKFESFLNVAEEDQAGVLAQLANQEQLSLAFYGDDLTHRFSKDIPHTEQQWQQLDELMAAAERYWQSLPPAQRDFDRAKAAFLRWSI